MGSTLTKKELIKYILKQTQEVSEKRLKVLRMTDLWLIQRKLTLEKYHNEQK